MMREQGFDVTWGSSCIDGSMANLDNSARQALSLVLHIENPWSGNLNKAPRLKNFPLPLICMDMDHTFHLTAEDEEIAIGYGMESEETEEQLPVF